MKNFSIIIFITVETLNSLPSQVCISMLMMVMSIGVRRASEVLKHCRYW